MTPHRGLIRPTRATHIFGTRFSVMRMLVGSVLVLCLVAAVCTTHTERVQVHDAAGQLVLDAPLPAGAAFGIRFIHSVAKSPVEEWFSAEGNKVRLNRTVYQDFGAGLPHEAAAGQTMIFKDGQIEISGYQLTLPRLDVRVGRVAQHEVLLPEGGAFRSIPLHTLAPPGAALSFSICTQSLAETLWRRVVYALNT